MEHEGAKILQDFGLPVMQGRLAKTKEEAVQIANEIGYPVVLKGMAPQVVHKTDAGFVALNVNNDEDTKEKFLEIERNAGKIAEADLNGVYVQKMAPQGIELMIGVKRDSIFGHQLVISLGGIFVEVMKDFAIRMMPVDEFDVQDMLHNLKGRQLLEGYRGGPKLDFNKLNRLIQGLNELIESRPNIDQMDMNPVIFDHQNVYICDVSMIELVDSEEVSPTIHHDDTSLYNGNLNQMLSPRSIAVIGASADPKKNGGRLFRYITENKFQGQLYPVNPKADEILDYQAYPNLKDVPGEIDLACIIVAARHVLSVIQDCIEKNVKTAIVYSSGFAETGEKGLKLQEEIHQLAKNNGLRILGPNSLGVASPCQNIYTAFGGALETKEKHSGGIAFISQSGAIGSALLSRAWEEGAGFSRWVSVGNEVDLSVSDFIHAFAEDEYTKVMSVFMESIKDVKAFSIAAQKAFSNNKPVIVFKTGASTIGQKTVQSHTGSIAGDDSVYSSAFEKLKVLRVNQIEAMIDVAKAFECNPLPQGRRMGILTASGGACSVLADLCEEHNLIIPDLDETSAKIKPLIPSFGSAVNPFDLTAEIIAKPQMFEQVLNTLIEDDKVDGVMIMLTTNADPGASVIAESILKIFNQNNKPLILGRLGSSTIAPQAMSIYQKANFPVYPTPERVVKAMSYMIKYSEWVQDA